MQFVIGNDIDPRIESLKKSLPVGIDAALVQQMLSTAADNPEGYGISIEVWNAWGIRHKCAREKLGADGESEIVYDEF